MATVLTRQQVITATTASLISHYGRPVEIEVKRSNYNRIPCIVFRSQSKGLVSALAAHHVAKLQRMAPTWKPWTSGVRYDKTTPELAYTVISLKGLTPKVLRAWLDAAQSHYFQVTVGDDVFVTPVASATSVEPEVIHGEFVETVVDTQPTQPAIRAHKPFGLPGKVATNSELRAVLRAQGKDTRGNKAALLARL